MYKTVTIKYQKAKAGPIYGLSYPEGLYLNHEKVRKEMTSILIQSKVVSINYKDSPQK